MKNKLALLTAATMALMPHARAAPDYAPEEEERMAGHRQHGRYVTSAHVGQAEQVDRKTHRPFCASTQKSQIATFRLRCSGWAEKSPFSTASAVLVESHIEF